MRTSCVLVLILVLSATRAFPEQCLTETFSDSSQFSGTWSVIHGTVAVELDWAHGHATGEDDPIFVLKDPASLQWQDISIDVDTYWNSNDAWCYDRLFFYLQSNTDWQPNLYPPNGYMFEMKAEQDNIGLTKFVGGSGTTLSLLNYTVTRGSMYHVRIVTLNGDISVYIGGVLAMHVSDNTFTSGTIGFGASTGGGGATYVDSYYDDVVVEGACPSTPIESSSWGRIKTVFR
jgi:hypothetical protein